MQGSSITEFINKIIYMMEKYPDVIRWADDGSELLIVNKKYFSDKALAEVYRHNKFQSFVRQLNMYGFHKVCRHKESINFRHPIFFKGNQHNFNQIKRRRKQQKQDTKQLILSEDQIEKIAVEQFKGSFPAIAEIISQMFKLKGQIQIEFNNLKSQFQTLNKQATPKKVKLIKPHISSIRQYTASFEVQSKKIESQIQKLLETVKIEQKSSQEEPQAEIVHNTVHHVMPHQLVYPFIHSNPSFFGLSSFCSYGSGSLTSFLI